MRSRSGAQCRVLDLGRKTLALLRSSPPVARADADSLRLAPDALDAFFREAGTTRGSVLNSRTSTSCLAPPLYVPVAAEAVVAADEAPASTLAASVGREPPGRTWYFAPRRGGTGGATSGSTTADCWASATTATSDCSGSVFVSIFCTTAAGAVAFVSVAAGGIEVVGSSAAGTEAELAAAAPLALLLSCK